MKTHFRQNDIIIVLPIIAHLMIDIGVGFASNGKS